MRWTTTTRRSTVERSRRANRRFVELEVSGDDSGLSDALRAHGAEGVTEGNGRWRIVLPPAVDLEVIWRVTARENLDVHHLTHRRDTLEEIFLKAVGHIQHTPGEQAQPLEEVTTDGRS